MDFLKTAIDKKENKLKRVMAENIVLSTLVGGVGGYLLSEAYTACMLETLGIQMAITSAFTVLGLIIGYFDGKAKQEELRLDLLLLRNLTEELK